MNRRGLLLLSFLLALMIAAFLPSSVRAQEGIRCTTTVAQSLINTGQSVFYSADPSSVGNGTVVFFWSTGDLEGNGQNADGNIELFRSELQFSADGSVARSFKQITQSTGSILGGFNLAPDVSTDGRFLVFFSDRNYASSGLDNSDGNFEIFVADVSDINNISLRQVTNTTQGSNLYPTISDDGRWITFISDNGLDPTTAGSVSDAERNLDIYLADLSTTPYGFRQITQTPLGVLNEAPNLSGDGSVLVFSSNQGFSNPEGNLEVYRYDVNSRLMSPLTTTPGGTNEMPVVSQDGSRVAFVSDQRLDATVNVVGGRQVFLSPNPATGTGFMQISNVPGADNFDPNISADGNRVIYQRLDGTGSQWVVLFDAIAQSRQIFRSRTNPTTGEVGAPVLSGNGTVLFYEDEGGISAVECSISDLGLTVESAPSSAIAGDSFVYVWTVSNLDQAIASGVQVQAALPSGLRLDAIEPSSACSVNAQNIACAFSRLEVGESQTMTATVQVGVDALGDLATHLVASSLTTVDPKPANNNQVITTTVSALADLGIVKSASPDTALQGEEITYTLSISNAGPSLAHDVLVTDSLPAGMVFVSSSSCVVASGEIVCALGDMLPGTLFTPTIRTRVNTFQELDIVNQAVVVSALTADPSPLNNRIQITNSVNTKFDLAIGATSAPAPLIAGGPITYEYVVTNLGPSAADNVQISVTLPSELDTIGQPQVVGGGSCTSGSVFTCDLGALARSQAMTILVTGTISSTVSGPIRTIANVRSLTEDNADRNPTNDEIGLTTTVAQQADLRVDKGVSHAAAVAGTIITYTLDVINLGPSAAPTVVLTDVLPGDVSMTGLDTSLGNCTGSLVLSCSMAGLLPLEQATVTVTAQVKSTALDVITNTVSVASTIFDPNLTNSSAVATTTVIVEADLKLFKSASVNVVTAGQDSFFYILRIANYGPSVARSVLLTDSLPAGLNYASSIMPDGSACSESAGIVTCVLGSIPAGITQTVRIDVATDSAAVGALVNNARVSSSALDLVADNQATATVNASQLADLQVTKSAAINNLNVGGTITYTVNLDNFGPSNATGVVISDLLPSELLAPIVSVNSGSYSQTTSLWTVGSIAAGQKLTMTVAGSLGATASGQVITNTALLNALNQTDPVSFNNGQIVTFSVPLNADVALVSSASALTPAVQSLVTFTFTATNSGPETATSVQVSDQLPAELNYLSQVASAGSYTTTTGLWSIGSLPAGASAVLTITTQVVSSGSFTNTAIISAGQYDDNQGDNTSTIGLTVGPAADLSLTNVALPSAPNVGNTLLFTVQVTNSGPDAVTDVQVLDLPEGGSFLTPAAGTTYSQTTGLWTIPILAVGESSTLVISRSLALSGFAANQAEIVAASIFDPDSTPGNGLGNGEDDQSSLSLVVPPASDLEVGMNASGGQLVGQDVLLAIQITNRGPDVATNIVLSETLPANLSYRTHFVLGPGVYVPATGAWTIPTLGVGDFTILNLTARVEPGAAGQLLTDEVEGVRLDQYDPGQFPNTDSVSFLVGGADLAVTKTVDRTAADVGGPVVYTIEVQNNGPSATTNIRITDSLPISLTGIVSATSAGEFGPNTPGASGVWRIPALAVGARETLVLTGTVIPGTANQVITNTISGAVSSVADGDPDNHTPAVGFRVTSADLLLQKSATITQPQEGESFFYILNVTNLGPDPATNVVVTDTMSTGMTTTVTGAGYDIATGRWTVGTLNPSQSKSLLLTVNPIVGVGGGLVIVDAIEAKSADQEDPTPAIDASARVTLTVLGADLRLVKSADKAAPDVGETVSFTVAFTNPGPYATGAIVITDTLPAGLTLVGSPTVTEGTVAMNGAGTIATWSHTSAPVGFTARLRITATVDSSTGGQSLINRAAIVSAQQTGGGAMPDPDTGNNTATATVTPQAADLTVELLDSPDPVNAGATLLYSGVISNTGPTAAANQTLTLTLPGSVALVSASLACDTSGFPTVICASSAALNVNATRTFTVAVTNNTVTTLNANATVSTTTLETDTGNNNASASTSVIPAEAATLVITGNASQTAGDTQDLTITAYDTLGNLAEGYTGSKSLTFAGANAAPDGTQPTVSNSDGAATDFGTPTTLTFSSGVATVSGLTNGALQLVLVETATVAVTDTVSGVGTGSSGALTVTVSAGLANRLLLGGSVTQTAGITQSLTITALDSLGNTATGYTGDKALTFSGASQALSGAQPTVSNNSGAAINFGTPTTITFASGVATASGGSNGGLRLVKAETAVVSATDGSINSTSGGDLTVTVAAASAARLTIAGSSTQTAGTTQDLTITAQDAFFNTAPSYTGSKTLIFSGAGLAPNGAQPTVRNSSGTTVNFGGNTAITFASGVAVTSSGNNGVLRLVKAENALISASDGSISAAGGGELAVAVSASAANRLVFATQPGSTANAGGNFSPFAVQVWDTFDNVADVSDEILLSAFTNSSCTTPAPGTLNGSGPLAAVNGVAAFSIVSYNQIDTIRLQASDSTNGGVTTACSNAIAVAPGVAGSLTVETQPGNATAGAAFSTQPRVALRDSNGNVLVSNNDATVTAVIDGGPGGFHASSTNPMTVTSGIANFSDLRLDTAGSYTLTFFTSIGAFTTTSASFTVSPGVATRLVIDGSASQTAGSTQNLTITARDSVGNTASSYTGGKNLTFTGAGVSPSGVAPTVSNSSGTAINFGTLTGINFSSGVATVSGGDNGVLQLVQVETALVAVTDTVSSIGTGNSGVLTVTVSPSSASKLVLGGSPTQTAGITQTLIITAQDSLGNTATGYSGNRVLTFSGANASTNGVQPTVTNSSGTAIPFGSTTTITFSNGVASTSGSSANGAMTLVRAESATISVVDSNGNSSSPDGNLAVTVSASSAVRLVISGSSAQTAGANQNLTIRARDIFSNTATGYTGSKILTFGGASPAPNATPPTVRSNGGATIAFGQPTTITFSSGVATVSSGNNGVLRLVKVETATIAVTDTLGGINSAGLGDLSVTVNPGAGTQLVITRQPGNAAAQQAFVQQPKVELRDALGNLATSDTSLNASVQSGPSGSFTASTTQVAFVAGEANFTNLRLDTAGNYTLRFTGIPSGLSVDSDSFTVGASSISKFVITGSSTQTAGITQTITIVAKDSLGNTVTSYSGGQSLVFRLDQGVGVAPDGTQAKVVDINGNLQPISTTTTINFTSGVATTGLILVRVEDDVILTASSGGIAAAGSDRLTVDVSAGAANNLTFNQQPSGSGTAGVNFAQQPKVQIRDQFNNTTAGTNTIALTAFTNTGCTTPGAGTLIGGSGTNAVSGVATFGGVNYTKAETIYLRATSSGLTAACSSGVTINPGDATRLVITGSVTQTAGVAQNLTITAQDAYSNTDTNFTGEHNLTFSGATNAPNGGIPTVTNKTGTPTNFGSPTTLDFVAGVATVSGGSNGAMVLKKAETATINVSEGGINSLSGGSLTVTVSGGAPNNLIFSTQPSGGANAGVSLTQQPVVQIRDQFNNSTTVTDTISLTPFTDAGCTSAASGTLNGGSGTAATSGTATFSGVNYEKAETVYLKAADSTTGGVTTACSTSIVVAAAFTVGKLVITGSATQTAGDAQAISVAAQDAFGNPFSGYVGGKTLVFSGANPAPDGTLPTALNNVSAPVNFGSTTAITFTNGNAVVSGLRLYKAEVAAISVTDTVGLVGSSGTGNLTVTVSPAAHDSFAFATVSSPRTVATPFSVTMTAQDQYSNTFTSFNSTVDLTTNAGIITPTVSGAFSSGVLTQPVTVTLAATNRVITATSASLIGVSNAFTVTPAAASAGTSTITAAPTSITATGTTTATITVQLKDANGNNRIAGGDTVTLAATAGTLSGVTDNENGTYTAVLTSTTTAGVSTVTGTVNSAAITDNEQVTFVPGAATQFVFANMTTQTAGATFTVTLTAKDANNNTVTTFNSAVTLTTTAGIITPTTASASFVSGVLTQPVTVTLAATNRVITATSGLVTGVSNGFDVNGGTATQFVFATAGTQTAGTPFTVTVTARDAFGNTATGFNSTATLTTTAGVITPTTSANFVSGVLTQPVTVTLAATNRVITATSGLVTGTSNGFTVAAGNATQFTFANVITQTAGSVFTVTVTARDAFGNTASGFNGTATLTTTAGVITPTTSASFVSGVLTQPVTVTLAATNRVITATSAGPIIGASNGFTVTAGTATHFVFANVGTQAAGTPFSVTLTARDAFSNTATGFNGTVTLTTTAGIITPTTASASFVSGVLTQPVTVTLAATNRVITATSTGPISGTSNGFTVSPGAAAQLVITQQPDLNPIASNTTPFAPQPILELRDAFNNVRTADTANVVADVFSGGGDGDLKGTKTLPLVSGVVTYTNLSISKVGTYVLIFTRGTFTATTPNIIVQAAGFDRLQLLVPGETAAPGDDPGKTGTPITQTAGVPFTVTVNGVDVNWNLFSAADGNNHTVGITSTDSLAILPADANLASGTKVFTVTLRTMGTPTLRARHIDDSGITPNTSPAITVVQPFSITKTATPGTVIAGQQITYTVRVTNTGVSALSTLRITDTLPITVSVVTSSTNGLMTCSGVGTVLCSMGTLTVNTSVVLTVTGTVSATALSGEQLVNSAQVGANGVSITRTATVTTTVQRSAVLTVTKTATSSSVTAGQQITYTVRITNTGPSVASGLRLTDTLPITVSGVTSSTVGGLVCGGSSVITCTLTSNLGVNASVALIMTGTVSATAPHNQPIVNTVAVSATEAAVVQSAQVTVTVVQPVGLSVTKVATPTVAIAGQQITYTVRITNTGPSTLNTVRLTDTLPVTVSVVTSSTTGGLACNGVGTITCTLSSLGAGNGVTLTITGTVSADAVHGQAITNIVTATAAEVAAAQTAQVATTVQRSVALTITKTAFSGTVLAGQQITYTVRITNSGPSAASNLVVTDTLPLSVTNPISSTGGVMVCSESGSLTCNLASLNPGSSVTWTITGTVSPGAQSGLVITNTAGATADEVSISQTAQVTTTVQRSVALTITKTATPNLVNAGSQITYTVRITNSGPSAASNLVVTDTLPLSVTTPISSTGGVMSCSGSSTITCTLASLGANSSVTLTITGTVSAAAPSGVPITNTAEVTATEVSIAQTAQVTTTVNTLADLQITKSEAYTSTPVVGSIVTYTLSITNSGPSFATAVYITDTLPVGVAFGSLIGMTPPNLFGTPVTTANAVFWMTDSLPTGSGLITFTGTITGSGTLTNSVAITSTTTDNTPGNNTNSTVGFTASGSTIATAVADLWLRAESTASSVALNASTEFVFRAGNRGPLAVEGATVAIQSASDLVARLLTEPNTHCPRTESGIICRLPLLLPGDEVDIGINIPVDQSGSFASIWAIESGLFDPNPDDNRVEQRWLVGSAEWRFFLPFLQSHLDTERDRVEQNEIYLPSVGSP